MLKRAAALGIVFLLSIFSSYSLPPITSGHSNIRSNGTRTASRPAFFTATPANAQPERDPQSENHVETFYIRPVAAEVAQAARPSPDTIDPEPTDSGVLLIAYKESKLVEDPETPNVEPVASSEEAAGETESDASETTESQLPSYRDVSDRSAASAYAIPIRLTESSGMTGLATYYHPSLEGLRMANGRPYDSSAMTTASNMWPLGTMLRVTYGDSIVVEVTDRGRFTHALDLSSGAFRALAGSLAPGVIRVTIEEYDGQEDVEPEEEASE